VKLLPCTQIDDLPFSATAADLHRLRGPPGREADNDVGMRELDYGNAVYRFQLSTGHLEEVTMRAPVLHLPGGVAVPFAALAAFLREHDPATFRAGGFIVSPAFGIAFDPSDSNWVTALAAHALPEWRKLATSS
jgi:hypothetical protein